MLDEKEKRNFNLNLKDSFKKSNFFEE